MPHMKSMKMKGMKKGSNKDGKRTSMYKSRTSTKVKARPTGNLPSKA